jgi:hypothetical protein
MYRVSPVIVDTEFLAEFFGVTERTIQLWAKDEKSPMPKLERDEYDLIEVVKWRIKRLEAKLEELGQGDPTLYRIKIKGEELRNAERQLKYEKLLGKLVDINDVKIAWTNETATFRSNAGGLVANLDIKLIGLVPDEKRNEARELIRNEVATYLNTLGELKIDVDEMDIVEEIDKMDEEDEN